MERYRITDRSAVQLAICVAAVLLMGVARQFPMDFSFFQAFLYAPVGHMILELFSIIVSALVVIISWQTLDRSHNSDANVLVFGFTIIICADFMHVLSYEGMPQFVSPSSTSKAIFFWLVGRFAELAVLLSVAAHAKFPGPRRRWFVSALLASIAVFYFGIFHLDKLPETFVPGQGVTLFKACLEYILCAGNLAISYWLFQFYRRSGKDQHLNYATAAFIMGVGELAFTNYMTPSDFINVLGHFYKVAAYGFVFRAAFITGLRQPYEKLLESEFLLAAKKNELETLLYNVPVAVVSLDRDFRYRYVNTVYDQNAGGGRAQHLAGQRLEDNVRPEVLSVWLPRFAEALAGARVEFDYSYQNAEGEFFYRSTIVVPERDARGDIQGILAILVDTSERVHAQNLLQESQHRMLGIQAALDAHAIVAITDVSGIITDVNDKFCEISQCSRSELIGLTYQILNSGFHPKTFFEDMWDTISSGTVWNGEICNVAQDGSSFWLFTTIVPFMDSEGMPAQYIAISADITKRKQAEQEVQHMAFHDALTGLPNRRLMIDRLGHAVLRAARKQRYGAVLLLDLDHFKEVNDTLGHAQGDAFLLNAASRLRASVRKSDTVARLGGDEFVIILEDIGKSMEDAMAHADGVSEKIRSAMEVPCKLGEHSVSTTLSAGVVLFRQAEDDPDELLKQADIALYKAKEQGRNRACYFDPSLQADVMARAALLADLRQAVDQDQLQLYYQPIVDAERRVLGVEALLRWAHPTRGLIFPEAFIPLIEQSHLISTIGQWVLEAACRQLRQWADDPVRSAWTISVNVSGRQFNDPEFVTNVQRAVNKAAADPSRLCLELTETILHEDLSVTKAKMTTLRDMGVRFSLDDFGTGYSSLSYLKRLPLDQLKIDRSFIADALNDANSAAIVVIILSLARNMDLRVVAEGVETMEQFAMLVEHGCHAFQGYLFSRPVPVESLATGFSEIGETEIRDYAE